MYQPGKRLGTRFRELVDEETQIQPNGLDLTVEKVERYVGGGEIRCDGKDVGEREPVETVDGFYNLTDGAYIVTYGEVIDIPDDCVGFVYPRSTLLRNGATLETAAWDAGYTGRGEGLLLVSESHGDSVTDFRIEQGSRIGQMVLATIDTDGNPETYDGEYDGENLEQN